MNGRMENQNKLFNRIESRIKNYPQFVISWYYYLKANECSATTCNDYINKIRRFLEFINNDYSSVKVTDITPEIVVNYFADVQLSGNYSDSYRQTTWSCLNNFFDYLLSINIIKKNYITQMHIKRGKNKDLNRINQNRVLLTKEDFHKILNAVENGVGSSGSQKYQRRYRNRDMSIMLLFMTTGIRKTALREININDIDIEKRKLIIVDKGQVLHEYTLSDKVLDYIKLWEVDRYFLLGDQKLDALFISRDGNRISGTSIAELIDKYATAALGYHISPHKLRAGFASIMYEETHDVEFVRRVIGHSNVETTQRYIVTANTEREKASEIMSNILS